MRSVAPRRETGLIRYSLQVGRLVELHATHAALLAAKQEAEQEAARVTRAKLDVEIAHNILREEMSNRIEAQARLAYLASHDGLTGLPNRTLFNDILLKATLDQRDNGRMFALMYIDLDHFKDVNDTRGHAVGDALLQAVAARLRKTLRAGETVARLGGDEFAIMQAGIQDTAQACALGDRLVSALKEPFLIEDRPVFIGASVGITIYPHDAAVLEILHRNADLAMYRAKSSGRDRAHLFDESLNKEVGRRSSLEQAMKEPLFLRQLNLVFQPQVHLGRQQVTGFEALIRWEHPQFGSIAPSEFIPLAERSGAINTIGSWLLLESCRRATEWPDSVLQNCTVAVNVAAAQFRNGDLPRLVRDVLAETGLPAASLELELTETGIMHDMRGAVTALKAINQLGVKLALDDFGTGYSSLSYLRQLPMDRIKIDGSFVKDMHESAEAVAMVRMIAKLAAELRMSTVAECIENNEQAILVRDVGCTFGQGYFYGRPTATPFAVGILQDTYS
jgi:diguanylate cyclase (GGDEF)-like protein